MEYRDLQALYQQWKEAEGADKQALVEDLTTAMRRHTGGESIRFMRLLEQLYKDYTNKDYKALYTKENK